MKTTRIFSLLLGLAFVSTGAYAGGDREDFVFFGDSLSDSGNRFYFEGNLSTPPYNAVLEDGMIPSAPYPIGGPTFSNGKVFTEHLAHALGRSGLSQPAWKGEGIAANYAYGGARAANNILPNNNVNLGAQVAQYIADGVKTDALHVVLIGGNDLGRALEIAALGLPFDPTVVVQDAVEQTFVSLLTLRASGAERFLLITSANPGLIPVFGADPAAIFGGWLFTSGFNCAIVGDGVLRVCPPSDPMVPTLKQVLESSGAEVLVFDGQAFFDNLYFNAPSFGLVNVTDPCITPNVAPFSCRNQDEYLYWDGIHPTRAVHRMIGEAIAAFLMQ